MRPGEIRHAGGAVVDDGQPSRRQSKIAQRGKAGMGRGEYIDIRRQLDVVAARRAVSGCRAHPAQSASRPAPPRRHARCRRARSPTLRHQMHRQRSKRMRASGDAHAATATGSRWSARTMSSLDAVGIGAAAAGADIVGARDFGLHIAAQCAIAARPLARFPRTSLARRRTNGNRR